MKVNKKPCHVIQVFSCSYEYDKKYRSYDSRKDYVDWKGEVSSGTSAGGDEVVISRSCFEKVEGVLGDLVILIDNNFHTFEDYLNLLKLNDQRCDDEGQLKQYYEKHLARQRNLIFGSVKPFGQHLEIFEIRFDKEIELFLNWDYWNVGEPRRENFKIAELKEGVPVNILIDGKRDFSLSGRRKRIYIENNYIIEYKGVFDTVSVLNENKVFSHKVPDDLKEVNLLRPLR